MQWGRDNEICVETNKNIGTRRDNQFVCVRGNNMRIFEGGGETIQISDTYSSES